MRDIVLCVSDFTLLDRVCIDLEVTRGHGDTRMAVSYFLEGYPPSFSLQYTLCLMGVIHQFHHWG